MISSLGRRWLFSVPISLLIWKYPNNKGNSYQLYFDLGKCNNVKFSAFSSRFYNQVVLYVLNVARGTFRKGLTVLSSPAEESSLSCMPVPWFLFSVTEAKAKFRHQTQKCFLCFDYLERAISIHCNFSGWITGLCWTRSCLHLIFNGCKDRAGF